ncbi:ribonuclease H-like domain-containing protein [Tanacetum coccineum]
MSGSQDEIPPPPPPPPSSSQTSTQQTPHTVSTIKLPILKRGEYNIWAMKMEHYLAHTDYPIWEVIQNGNGPVSIAIDTSGQIKVLPPRTAEEIVARERERKARTTLLMALPEDHLAKFHKMTDAKEMWDAIKSRFGGNDESKKMQKYILKQQFKGFSVSNTEGLHKGYDRFQSLLSQLDIHGEGVSTKDANQKFLRSIPSAWSQVSLIMRTKPGVDSLSFDDLYNNLRVFESDYEQTSSYSLLANQSNCPQLDHEDLEHIDEYDLEEMDLKWQVAMIAMRMKRFYKKTGHFARECRIKGNQDNRRRDAWNSRNKDRSRIRKKEDSKALVIVDGEGVDWTNHSEEDKDYALMACNSSDSDTEREQLSDASIEIKAYSQGLKKVEAQLVAHQQGQLWASGDHRYDGILSYENEVLQSVFMNKESELEKQPVYDSTEPSELASEPVVNELNVECQPKVWSDAPIIEEYELDSDDEYVSIPIKEKETPSFANQYYDFHEKRMARKPELNNGWNNVQRVNKQNQFVPSAVLTRTGKIPVSTAKASVSTVGGKGKLLLSPQQVVIGDHKETTGTMSLNTMVDPVLEIDYPHRALKNKGIVDSGCSRHMTGNNAYLAKFQDFNGGPVAFGGSKGYITGKGPQEATNNAGIEDIIDAGDFDKEDESAQDCFVLPIWTSYSLTFSLDLKTDAKRASLSEEEQVFLDELERLKRQEKEANEEAEALRKKFAQDTENLVIQEGTARARSTNIFSTDITPAKSSSTNLVNIVSTQVSSTSPQEGITLSDPTNPEQDDSEIPPFEDIYQNSSDGIFTTSSYDDEGAEADFANFETIVNVSPIPTSRIHSSHPFALILGDPTLVVQTRSKVHKSSGAHAFVSYVQKQRRNNHKDFQHCLFACFLSQNEPKKILEALADESWVDAMQEELLQFEIQKVWVLVDLPYGKKAISSKSVYRNKKDERGVVVKNKARIFLALPSYMGFVVYQMDVKSAFLYGKIDEEVYVSQPPGFLDPKYPQKVYKKSWCDEFEALMKSRFQMSSMGELTFFLGLQVKQKEDGIFISQDKYVAEILKKFHFANVKTASTPIETQKPLVKDEEASDMDVHLYMTILEQTLIGNPQHEVVNFLAGDSFLGNEKSKPLWLLLLRRQNMLLLQAAVGKFCRFKIKC